MRYDGLRLIHGDDSSALRAGAGDVDEVVDADSCPSAEILDRSGGGLFGPVRLLVLNAQSLDTSVIGQLAGRTVTLRVDGKASASLVRAVQGAGGTVEQFALPKDPAEAAVSEARRLGVRLDPGGRRAISRCCANDVLLARSVIRACHVAGINEIGPRQVERLTGGTGADVQLRDVARAVRSGQVAGAVVALDRCRADPHAIVASVRRELAGMDAVPAECAHLLARAESRLRSTGRDAALWVLLVQVAASVSNGTSGADTRG